MSSAENSTSTDKFQRFLDKELYERHKILRFEQIYGKTWVSTGGQETTEELFNELDLKSGMQMLDVGCGIGGSAFYAARKYGMLVNGIDLSRNMIGIANERRDEMSAGVRHRVQFHVEDATSMEYPDSFYDMVYSRDAILHMDNKEILFKKFLHCLKPGGVLLITDYCRGDQEHGAQFKGYVKQRDYKFLAVQDYSNSLSRAGFGNVVAMDRTASCTAILKTELARYEQDKAVVLGKFSVEDYNAICDGWRGKIEKCSNGDLAWGYFKAQKMFD